MGGTMTVRPDKNEFLLYALLNALGQAPGQPDVHFLRRKAVDHFAGYVGNGLRRKDYGHHSKPVGLVLALNEAPDLTWREEVVAGNHVSDDLKHDWHWGKAVLPHMLHFYEHTDFESFYRSILPQYAEECDFLHGIVDNANIATLLDEVWETEEPMDMVVIPMPLESRNAGVGPSIGGVAYQIIGPPFDNSKLHLIGHEGSHPRAKRVLGPLRETIAREEHLLLRALADPQYPSCYRDFNICFEEHLIRAMQLGWIDPVLDEHAPSVGRALRREELHNGMVFIRDFYDEIKGYKANPKGSLQDVALRILDRIGR